MRTAVLVSCLFALSCAIPVFVMMPLDLVSSDGKLDEQRANTALQKLRNIGADGIMVDVWWGIVEREGPMAYDWSAYERLAQMCQDSKLQLQLVLSFHQCGGNVGDACNIPLPPWVLEIGKSNPDIFYTDIEGHRDREYISLGADDVEVLNGRTPIAVYTDFMQSFQRTFADYFGNTIVEIMIGMGPAGELRYPSYQSAYWKFPGIGEFQCYDRYMQASLKAAAVNASHPEWGTAPTDAGRYNDQPQNTLFFADKGGWQMEYGRFFLTWYSEMLVEHGAKILGSAQTIFNTTEGVHLAAKISGIHWWYDTPSHAAELTAGYYNVLNHDGYARIISMLSTFGANVDFTMLEMTNQDNPGAKSLPETLVKQVFQDAITANVGFSGENALARYDQAAYAHIESVSRLNGKVLESFTYLRWSDSLQQQENWNTFAVFVSSMHGITVAAIRQKLLLEAIPKNHHHIALLPPSHR